MVPSLQTTAPAPADGEELAAADPPDAGVVAAELVARKDADLDAPIAFARNARRGFRAEFCAPRRTDQPRGDASSRGANLDGPPSLRVICLQGMRGF